MSKYFINNFQEKDKLNKTKKRLSDEMKLALYSGAAGAASGAVTKSINSSANAAWKAIIVNGKKIYKLVKI